MTELSKYVTKKINKGVSPIHAGLLKLDVVFIILILLYIVTVAQAVYQLVPLTCRNILS